jgi:ubiquinone/menaquinone biosynthesis C-methylase UbiE
MTTAGGHEFSGVRGHFFAWFLTSPMRRVLEWKMGRPEERLLELLALRGDERVLDAGSGSGFHSLMIAQHVPEGAVIAVDISPQMLERLERNALKQGLRDRVEITLADGLSLPLEDSSVDRAISAAVWHHLDDPQMACDELVRVLKPGGRAVVSDLLIQGSIRGLEGHDRAFEPEDMRRILERSGLAAVEVEVLGRWVIGSGTRPERS